MTVVLLLSPFIALTANASCDGVYEYAGRYFVSKDLQVFDYDTGTIVSDVGQQRDDFVIAHGPEDAGEGAYVLSRGLSGTHLLFNTTDADPNVGEVDSLCYRIETQPSSMRCVDVGDAGSFQFMPTRLNETSCAVDAMVYLYTEPATPGCTSQLCLPAIGLATMTRIGSVGASLPVDADSSWAGEYTVSGSVLVSEDDTNENKRTISYGLLNSTISVQPGDAGPQSYVTYLQDTPADLCFAYGSEMTCISVSDPSTTVLSSSGGGVLTRPKSIGCELPDCRASAATIALERMSGEDGDAGPVPEGGCGPGEIDFSGFWQRINSYMIAEPDGSIARASSNNTLFDVTIVPGLLPQTYTLSYGNVSVALDIVDDSPESDDPGRFLPDALCVSGPDGVLSCADVGDLGTTIVHPVALDDSCAVTEALYVYMEPQIPGGCAIAHGTYSRVDLP